MKRHCRGEVSERLKELASKASVGEILPWVRIPPSPPFFKRDRGASGESTFRYVFAQPNDSNREIILTILAFDIPTQVTESATK
jgi:hypothetical protein